MAKVMRKEARRVEDGLSRSLSGGGGKPSCPSPSAGDLREIPGVPLRGEGSCGGGGAPRDSAGSGPRCVWARESTAPAQGMKAEL